MEVETITPEVMPMTALESISRAEIDVQIATAKKYPRQLGLVKRDMLTMATLDEETAAACFYTLPRGGKNIQGGSVRLAEIAVSCFGNIRVATRTVSVEATGDTPHVTVQSACHDLEKNVAVCIEKRRRITKKKAKNVVDEDDINLAVNACAAIAFRDAAFKVIPGVLVKGVFEAAKKVAIGDATTLADRRAKAFETFAKMGAQAPRILAALGKATIDDVTLSDLETLLGTYSAIRDGETTIDAAFPAVSSTAPLAEKIAAKQAERAQAEKPPDAPIESVQATGVRTPHLKARQVLKDLAEQKGWSTAQLTDSLHNLGPDATAAELGMDAESFGKLMEG